jgi:hypothetical protein
MEKQIIYRKPFSTHPNDWYLSVVMAYLPHNEITPYVTWLSNSSFKEYECEGHYFKNRKDAEKDFLERGRFPVTEVWQGEIEKVESSA